MSSEKNNPPVACLLHELARDIVDCSDMVGIESVTQTESVGEEGCSQQGRIVMKGDQCPEPRGKIACNEQHIHANDLSSTAAACVAEGLGDCRFHPAVALKSKTWAIC